MIRFASDDDAEVYLLSKCVVLDGCWLWGGFLDPRGYGRVGYRYKILLAHRLMYELRVGKIPDGLELDHLCRRRECINPAHLEPVTHRNNVRRGVGPSAINAKKQSCRCGEPYSVMSGERRCRKCAREYNREYCIANQVRRNALARARYAKKLAPVRGIGMEYSEKFLAFWDAYKCKRRVKKLSAWLAWQKRGCEAIADEVMRGLASFKTTEQWASGFMPEPERWLVHMRWEDSPAEQDEPAAHDGWDVSGPPRG